MRIEPKTVLFAIASAQYPRAEPTGSCLSKTTIETGASVLTGRLRTHTSSRSGEREQDTSVYGYGETDYGYRSCDWGESSRSITQALAPRPSSVQLCSPISQKSTSTLRSNTSRFDSLPRPILEYHPGSPQRSLRPEPHVGGQLQTVPRGILRTERVSSEVRSFL